MTEKEWMESVDCGPMIQFLSPFQSFRKINLFLVAVGRSIQRYLPEPISRDVFDWLEKFADGQDDSADERRDRDWNSEGAAFGLERESRSNYFIWKRQLDELSEDELESVAGWGQGTHRTSIRDLFVDAAYFANNACGGFETGNFNDGRYNFFLNPNLLRDIFGNPFRPVNFDISWCSEAVTTLTQSMYDSRDFSAMPILADCLEEAGCHSANMLSHCRDPKQIHVRGCWVVDLVLGKA